MLIAVVATVKAIGMPFEGRCATGLRSRKSALTTARLSLSICADGIVRAASAAEQRNIPQDRSNVNNDPPIGNDARLLCRTDCSSPSRCPRLALDDRFWARSFDATTTSMVFALIYLMFSAPGS